VKIDAVSERLDDGDNTGLECFPRRGLKIEKKRPDRAAAKIAQEPAFELEEEAQHLGDRKDHLAVRHVQKERLPHPLAPFLKTLGMTGGTKPPGLAGKHQEMLGPAARTADPGEPAARIAAVKILLHDVRDDRPVIAVSPLESALIFRDEALEMMEKDPVEFFVLIKSFHFWY